ncbi:YgfZ/GcvT domain-containing protein [Methylomarinovum tepidoasis]|uniref:CAF17-like 4Fe-4S cluster assembly/insertion protein YgfZ n=1 Tax=Methylomarinovum tepidoasis TaxID=2840183 RepID=UPI002572E9CD|nr:folate-binding protein [Methylomarinovum sp. IN45]
MTDLAVAKVGGRDAAAFLQGQITCDVHRINEGQSGLGAVCNPQGRVLANFRILKHDAAFLLVLAADLAEDIAQHLRRYVLRADVTLAVTEWACLGIRGELLRLPQTPPRVGDEIIWIGRIAWIRVPDTLPRWLLLGQRADLEAGLRPSEAREAPPACWRLHDIRSGLPWVTAATSGRFLPQMLNLDLLGGISFDKGCYTGQEIIARTHYRGQVKRRLYRFFAAGAEPPPPGTALVAGEEGVGQVINSAPAAKGTELLAVVRCDAVHGSALRLTSAPQHPLQRRDLAYTVP